MKKIFFVDKNFEGSRLDRWIRKNISDLPQSLIEKNIRKGNIKINNKKRKGSHKLFLNDKINLYNFNFLPDKNKKKLDPYNPTKKEIIYSSSLFIEDNENFVVINKPSGIAVQSGTKSKRNILDILKKTKEFEGFSPYPVHRIDKETTGILIVAKNRAYAQLFTSLFRIRKIHKTYLGLVLGDFHEQKGTYIDTLIHHEGEKEVKSKAITHYKVLDSNKNYSLLRLNPETGRKHQLRKQLLIHGHPIIGDSKYRLTTNKYTKKENLLLHAYKINFFINKIKYNYKANLTSVFLKALKEKFLKIV